MDGSCFENDFGRTGFSLSVFFVFSLKKSKLNKNIHVISISHTKIT